MVVKCPHCGTKYEVEKKDLYHYTTCGVCGNGFVIGVTTSLQSSDEKSQQKDRQSASGTSVPHSRPFAGRIGSVATHPSVSLSNYEKVPEHVYFIAWLAYSFASFIASMLIGFVFGGVIGFFLGLAGVRMDSIISIGWVVGLILSMPIGYCSFRYIAIFIISKRK